MVFVRFVSNKYCAKPVTRIIKELTITYETPICSPRRCFKVYNYRQLFFGFSVPDHVETIFSLD